MKKLFVLILIIGVYLAAGLSFFACAGEEAGPPAGTAVKTIQSMDEFKKIIESSPNRLMVFDLYADWCSPCRILSPMLEEIARENKVKADFYKIDVDELRQLASAFRVSGIPHVAFLKNKTIVYALVGVRPKSVYVRAINQFSEKGNEALVSQPDGEIVNGVREIRFKAGIDPHSIYVFRGEMVKLIIEKQPFPFSVHIPDFNISEAAKENEDLEVTFKAKKIGVYPIFCNGDCPAGDGALHGKIIVMQYKPEGEARYKELTTAEAKTFIEKNNPLILDVRPPREYYSGHLPGAMLIPLQQLAERIPEIESYKNKEILIYGRSGNRSTVASEILIKNGFKKIYNLRDGILGWEKKRFDIKRERTGIII